MRRVMVFICVILIVCSGCFGCAQKELTSFHGMSMEAFRQAVNEIISEYGYETKADSYICQKSLDVHGNEIETYRLMIDDSISIKLMCYEHHQKILISQRIEKTDVSQRSPKFYDTLYAVLKVLEPKVEQTELYTLFFDSNESYRTVEYLGYTLIFNQTRTIYYVLIAQSE